MKIAKLLLKTVTMLTFLGGISSFAQTNVVYSVNMVGFQKVTADGLLDPGANSEMVATPFIAGDTDIQAAIGVQLGEGLTVGEGDNLVFYTPGVGYETFFRVGDVGDPNFDFKWLDPDFNVAVKDIVPGSGFWIRNKQSSTQEVIFVGEVVTDTNVSLNVVSGLQILSYPYSAEFDLPNDQSLRTSGALTGATAGEADNIVLWDSASSSYVTYFPVADVGDPYYNFKWLRSSDFEPITDPIASGRAFWYRHKSSGFTWSSVKPY